MADVNIEIIDVIYPSGGIAPVLRQVRDGRVRVFTLTEIDSAGMFIAQQNAPVKLCEVFENNA